MGTDNEKRTIFRHGEIHEQAIQHVMDTEFVSRSEAVRTIIEEWLYHVASK